MAIGKVVRDLPRARRAITHESAHPARALDGEAMTGRVIAAALVAWLASDATIAIAQESELPRRAVDQALEAEAHALALEGRYEEALQRLLPILHRTPYAHLHCVAGYYAFRAGDLTFAASELDVGVRAHEDGLPPNPYQHGLCLYRRGLVFEARGDTRRAALAYRTSLQLRSDPEVQRRLDAILPLLRRPLPPLPVRPSYPAGGSSASLASLRTSMSVPACAAARASSMWFYGRARVEYPRCGARMIDAPAPRDGGPPVSLMELAPRARDGSRGAGVLYAALEHDGRALAIGPVAHEDSSVGDIPARIEVVETRWIPTLAATPGILALRLHKTESETDEGCTEEYTRELLVVCAPEGESWRCGERDLGTSTAFRCEDDGDQPEPPERSPGWGDPFTIDATGQIEAGAGDRLWRGTISELHPPMSTRDAEEPPASR